MKKTLAVFISLGVILLIAGLTILGIFGGEAIKNKSWDDIVNGYSHDLSSAELLASYSEEQFVSIFDMNKKVIISADSYCVYVLPATDGVLSVKFFSPSDEGVEIGIESAQHMLEIRETDNLAHRWFSSTRRNGFIAMYIPQTEAFVDIELDVGCHTAKAKVNDLSLQHLACFTGTGSVSVSNCKVNDKCVVYSNTGTASVENVDCKDLIATTHTGAINISKVNAESIEAKVDTGSVKCTETTACEFDAESDTGSVKFDIKADDIRAATDTGSVKGTVQGKKSDYIIDCNSNTGSCNLNNQHPEAATKHLLIVVDTGSIKVEFSEK